MPRFNTTADTGAPLWRATDPNYPEVPQPPEVVARSTSKANVTYDDYVHRHAALQRNHILLMVTGIVATICAAYYLSGIALVIVAAVAVGLAFAGAVGFATAAGAHRSYTQHLAISTSETYERPAAATPQPATVRPFVVSSSGDGRTTNTGRLDFAPEVWRDFFDRALANGGAVNRDDVAKKALERSWYYGEGYGKLLEELTRLGFIDARNRLTPAALAWYDQQIALPLTTIPVRPRVGRTDGRTDGADGAFWGSRGVGE